MVVTQFRLIPDCLLGNRRIWAHDLKDQEQRQLKAEKPKQLLFGGVPVNDMTTLVAASKRELRRERAEQQVREMARRELTVGEKRGAGRVEELTHSKQGDFEQQLQLAPVLAGSGLGGGKGSR